MMYHSNYFGQAYGEGDYGSGLYSCTTQQEQQGICTVGAGTGTNPGSGTGGSLSNTGIGIIAVVTLACLIVFVALVVRFWRRKPQPQHTVVLPGADTTDNQHN